MSTSRSGPEAPRAQTDAGERIKAWLGTLDATLRAIETTAWRVRSASDEARTTVQAIAGWQTRVSRLADAAAHAMLDHS